MFHRTTITAVTEKVKEPEVEFDKNSIPLKTMLKAHDRGKKAYKFFIQVEDSLDISKKKDKELPSQAQDWVNANFNPKYYIPEKKSYAKALWTYLVTANARLYEKATVPGISGRSSGQTTTLKRFPRIPIPQDGKEAWDTEVNKILERTWSRLRGNSVSWGSWGRQWRLRSYTLTRTSLSRNYHRWG